MQEFSFHQAVHWADRNDSSISQIVNIGWAGGLGKQGKGAEGGRAAVSYGDLQQGWKEGWKQAHSFILLRSLLMQYTRTRVQG